MVFSRNEEDCYKKCGACMNEEMIETIETIVECMSSDKDMNAVQRIQTEHRHSCRMKNGKLL